MERNNWASQNSQRVVELIKKKNFWRSALILPSTITSLQVAAEDILRTGITAYLFSTFKSAHLLLQEGTKRRNVSERSALFVRGGRWRLLFYPSTFSHLVAFPQFFNLKTLLLYNLTVFLYMFICASLMNAQVLHEMDGSVECWRDNVWEGTWKQLVVDLLETLCRRLAGRTENSYT
jgi:hypothetical protein